MSQSIASNGSTITTGSLHFGGIQSQVSFLEGEILTIIDATISEPAQNKATKDLVRSAFRARLNYVSEMCRPSTTWSGGAPGNSSGVTLC